MDLLIAGLAALTIGADVHSAMEFSDDNRPRVTLVKHLEYQIKLRDAGKLSRMPNKLLNYNVKIDIKDKPQSIEVVGDIRNFQYVIAEPAGWSNNKMIYQARAICSKKFTNCISLTQTLHELGY